MSDVLYAGQRIAAADGIEFIIVTDNGKISYMNLNTCEVPTQWFSTYEKMMENFNMCSEHKAPVYVFRSLVTRIMKMDNVEFQCRVAGSMPQQYFKLLSETERELQVKNAILQMPEDVLLEFLNELQDRERNASD